MVKLNKLLLVLQCTVTNFICYTMRSSSTYEPIKHVESFEKVVRQRIARTLTQKNINSNNRTKPINS